MEQSAGTNDAVSTSDPLSEGYMKEMWKHGLTGRYISSHSHYARVISMLTQHFQNDLRNSAKNGRLVLRFTECICIISWLLFNKITMITLTRSGIISRWLKDRYCALPE